MCWVEYVAVRLRNIVGVFGKRATTVKPGALLTVLGDLRLLIRTFCVYSPFVCLGPRVHLRPHRRHASFSRNPCSPSEGCIMNSLCVPDGTNLALCRPLLRLWHRMVQAPQRQRVDCAGSAHWSLLGRFPTAISVSAPVHGHSLHAQEPLRSELTGKCGDFH